MNLFVEMALKGLNAKRMGLIGLDALTVIEKRALLTMIKDLERVVNEKKVLSDEHKA